MSDRYAARRQRLAAGQLYGQASICISMDWIARVSVCGDAMRCDGVQVDGAERVDGDANNRKEREKGMGAAHESCRRARF